MTKQNMLPIPPRMVTCYMTQREPHITAAGYLRGFSVSGIWRKNAMGKPIEGLGGTVDTNKMHGRNDHANSHFQSNLAARKGGLTEPCSWLVL